MPFAGLPDYMRRVRAGESLERPVEKLQAERRQLIEDYRELLATDDDRAAYDQMITLAHRVFPYVEGHKFYCEHWYTNLFFNKIREFGALLAAHGFFPGAEDVFHLTHYELEAAIIDLMNSWSTGSPPRGPDRWPAIVAERRAAIAVWAKHDTPPALGPVPDVIDDPAIVMLWGITRESLETWLQGGQRCIEQRAPGIRRFQRNRRRPRVRRQVGGGNRTPAEKETSSSARSRIRRGRRCSRRSRAPYPTSAAR